MSSKASGMSNMDKMRQLTEELNRKNPSVQNRVLSAINPVQSAGLPPLHPPLDRPTGEDTQTNLNKQINIEFSTASAIASTFSSSQEVKIQEECKDSRLRLAPIDNEARLKLAKKVLSYKYREFGTPSQAVVSEEAYSRLMDFIFDFHLNRKKVLTCLIDMYLPKPTMPQAGIGFWGRGAELLLQPTLFNQEYQVPTWLNNYSPNRDTRTRLIAFHADVYLKLKMQELSKRGISTNSLAEALLMHVFPKARMLYPVKRKYNI